MCDKVVCDKVVCDMVVCDKVVCDNVVRDKVVCERYCVTKLYVEVREEEEEAEDVHAGCRFKNKSPTQFFEEI